MFKMLITVLVIGCMLSPVTLFARDIEFHAEIGVVAGDPGGEYEPVVGPDFDPDGKDDDQIILILPLFGGNTPLIILIPMFVDQYQQIKNESKVISHLINR
jgi:hypothetical protein